MSFHEILDLSPAALELMADYIPRFRFVLDDISAETDRAGDPGGDRERGRLAS